MRKAIRSFDVVLSFELQQKPNRSHNPPERADTVAIVRVVPIQDAIGVDVADVASYSV